MAEQGFIFHAEGSMTHSRRHCPSQSPFSVGFCSPPSVTQHLVNHSPLRPYSSQGLLPQPDLFLCPSFSQETPASVPGTSLCMRTPPLPLPFDWTFRRERFHGDFVMTVSPYTVGSMEHTGRMLETPVFEFRNDLPVPLSTDQASCTLSSPRSHSAHANGKGAKSSMGLNPWAPDYKPLYQRWKRGQTMENNNDIKNFSQKAFVSSSQASSIQICEIKLCRKDDAETTGSSSEGAKIKCSAKEKWNERVPDITGNEYNDVSVQTEELHVKYAEESSLHYAKDKTERSSQTCSRSNGMLLRKEAAMQTDNCYEHKSLQTECLQVTAEQLKKEVQKLQIEVCHLRAEQCIKDLHRQILTLTQDKMLWQTYFITGSEAEGSVIDIIDERISWLHSEIKRLQNQLSQCLNKLEKGEILSGLPEFFLILPDNKVYLPTASARSASGKTAPSFSDTLRSPLSSTGSKSLKRQKFKSQDASKKHMNLAEAESALSKPSQNSCRFSFGGKENLTVFDLQSSSPVRQQSYNEHCPISVSSPRVCENGCKKPDKQNFSVTSQKYTHKDSSLHNIMTANKPSLTEFVNDDSAKYSTCPASTMVESSDKENEIQQLDCMPKHKQSEADYSSFEKDRLVEKSSQDKACCTFLQLQDTDKYADLQAIQGVAKKLAQKVAKPTDSCFVQENRDDATDIKTTTESADCCSKWNTDKPPMKEDPQQSKKIPETLPCEQIQGGSLKSGEREKLSLYQDAAVSSEHNHRRMSRLVKNNCFLEQISFFATDSQKTKRNENAETDDRFQIQSNYAENPRSKLSDYRTLPEQSQKVSSELLDDMGRTSEQFYYEAFQESLDNRMFLEPSDQTANKQNYKIQEKSKALAVSCEHEDLYLQMNLKESVVPCFESDFFSPAFLPGPVIKNGMNVVAEDTLSPIQVSKEALDVARLGTEADETSVNDNHECHLKHVSNSLLETFDVDVEDIVSDDEIKFTATAAATLIDVQQSDRRRNSELITASSVSVFSSMAEGKTDGQVGDHDDVHPSSDLAGHLNATLYRQHAVANEGGTYFAFEVKNAPEQEKKQENTCTSALEMRAIEESETRIPDHKGTLTITSSTNSLTTGHTASDTDKTLSSKVTVTEKLIEIDVSTNLGSRCSLSPSVDHQTFTPQAASGMPVMYMLPSSFSSSASCSGEVISTASPTGALAPPTPFLTHHLQPSILPAALQITSHAELPSTDLQSSSVVASSTRLISSTLSELDFPSDSDFSHSQEPNVQSSSTISSPLQRPGIPAHSVIFSTPQEPSIPGLEGILSGTNSSSPCTNDLYLTVLATLTLDYPVQACDSVWLQKTAWEQTQLLHTALQNQQGPLTQLKAAGWQPPCKELLSACVNQLPNPMTPGPSSASASLVPASVTDSPCHPQTTTDAPFAKQTSLQVSPEACVPPGFQKIDHKEGRDDDSLEVWSQQGQASCRSFSLESSDSKSERSESLSSKRTSSPQMTAMNFSKSLVTAELQDSSWRDLAIAKKSDDDGNFRPSCQSGARVHKGESDHPTAVHVSHGCIIETPDPQFNILTNSVSLCKNSHDSDLELGCKIHTGGSVDQNQSFVTSENTLKNASQMENSYEWKKMGKHCKMDKVKEEEQRTNTTDAKNNLPASCHQKLVRFIMKTFPGLTPEQLSKVIAKVKEEFNGCLRGQLFSDITKKAKFVVMHTYPNVARPMNIASACCAICHEEMKPQGLEKMTCGHFIHVQCITKWAAQDRQCPTCHKLVSEFF